MVLLSIESKNLCQKYPFSSSAYEKLTFFEIQTEFTQKNFLISNDYWWNAGKKLKFVNIHTFA